MENPWLLARPARACASCAASFVAGTSHFATLEARGGALARRDFCEGCFRASERESPAIFWKTWAVRESARSARIDLEGVRDAFARLAEDRSEDRRDLRYLLALLLLRKKRLRLRGTERGEGGVPDRLLVALERSGPTIEVEVPAIGHERLDALREELRSFLGGRGGDSGASAPTPPEPDPDPTC